MKIVGLVVCIFFSLAINGQDTTYIKVHFKYGSKPARGFKNEEPKWFGGIHGGHVTVEIGDSTYGFSPSSGARIFAKKSHSNGYFHLEKNMMYDSDSVLNKHLTIRIPVSKTEFIAIRNKVKLYLQETPYDYALFGMRCAASAHDMLSAGGVFKNRSRLFSVFYNFYPKKLRKRVLDFAYEKHWEIHFQEGRESRKWENDKRRHRKKLESRIKK